MSEPRKRGIYDNNPAGTWYWPKDLPARRDAQYARQLHTAGYGNGEIQRRTRLSTNRVLAITTVPHMYDPVDDTVAIQRALEGDRSVLPDLTYYERDTLRRLLVHRYRKEPYDQQRNRGWDGEPYWLTVLAEDWGIPAGKALRFVQKIVQRGGDGTVAA